MSNKDPTLEPKKPQDIDETLISMLHELQKSLLIMIETIEYYIKVRGLK
jgi:hypothetical protein